MGQKVKTIREIVDEIRQLNGGGSKKDLQKKINLCFELMELFCKSPEDAKNKGEISCHYAATVLSSIVRKGLGTRTLNFTQEFIGKLPLRTELLLLESIPKMEGLPN
jgi:hypothetical protein